MELWTDKHKRSENEFAHLMDSPSSDRAPDIWAHMPPEPFERTATVMAKLGAQIHKRFDTWAVPDEMHRTLMADIKSFAQEAFLEGKKHGLWIGEQDAIVSQSKVAEHQKREWQRLRG